MMSAAVSHLDDPQYELGLDCGLRDLNWLYLRRFLAELERDFDQKRTYLAYLATRWSTAYDMLASFEQTVILGGNPSDFERTYFQACAAQLRGKGLHLLALLRQNGGLEIEKLLGFSCDDIAAMVQQLEISEGIIHRAMTQARRQELSAIFGGYSARTA